MGDDRLEYEDLLLEVTIGSVIKECVGEAIRMAEEDIDNKNMDCILLTPPATDPDSPVNECKDNLETQTMEICAYSDTITSVNSEDSKTDSIENIQVCKWTNCDWPGIHDDLVDHIREIHVELQPYHNHQDICSSPTAFNSLTKSSSSNTSNSLDSGKLLNGRLKTSHHRLTATTKSSSSSSSTSTTSTDLQPQHQYVCLWEGCKVYGKGSLSRSWIERHVLQHSGPRPFKCIVEGCNERFKKREALERHVNNHFNFPMSDLSTLNCSSSLPNVPPETDSNANIYSNDQLSAQSADLMSTKAHHPNGHDLNCNLTSGSTTPNKLLKRKKLAKARKKFYNVKASEDYFDDGIMDIIKYRLMEISMITGLDVFGNQSDVIFHSKVIGRCCPEKDGAVNKVLIHWEPEGIIPDEWILESDLDEMSSRRVPLKSLPNDSFVGFFDKAMDGRRRGRKLKRN